MTFRIHHMNCGTMCPLCARLINGSGGWTTRAKLVCHCLLIESDHGLILVDTGVGTGDVKEPKRRLGGGFLAMTNPKLDLSETAFVQIKAKGLNPADVTHIVPTHLDLDHAGGLSDFPDAQVHVLGVELKHAIQPSKKDSLRFRKAQFEHGPRWVEHNHTPLNWFGFEALAPIPELADQLLMVPLIGHTRGHVGVAVRNDQKWLLHAGDAYFHRTQVAATLAMPAGLKVFEQLVQTLPEPRKRTTARLRELALKHPNDVELFCAHDPVEFERYQ
ncbi:MBL fold metallo-hydrolase [Limnobacter humi]|uniref:MBL fold metallo-hydrolase n=1 Tax=Limnobacter humi TaxID=1778671 RepID=A0ABT1WDL4_9BURK|nr:MBL fold metallo-hydrolase [Limnobacter humi]MCQ8895469.1 MBL fold metallo-hydrolase [Limnobacter humi]